MKKFVLIFSLLFFSNNIYSDAQGAKKAFTDARKILLETQIAASVTSLIYCTIQCKISFWTHNAFIPHAPAVITCVPNDVLCLEGTPLCVIIDNITNILGITGLAFYPLQIAMDLLIKDRGVDTFDDGCINLADPNPCICEKGGGTWANNACDYGNCEDISDLMQKESCFCEKNGNIFVPISTISTSSYCIDSNATCEVFNKEELIYKKCVCEASNWTWVEEENNCEETTIVNNEEEKTPSIFNSSASNSKNDALKNKAASINSASIKKGAAYGSPNMGGSSLLGLKYTEEKNNSNSSSNLYGTSKAVFKPNEAALTFDQIKNNYRIQMEKNSKKTGILSKDADLFDKITYAYQEYNKGSYNTQK